MLRDVLCAIEGAGGAPVVLATRPMEIECPVMVDEGSLSEAINAVLEEDVPCAVVMADLALATPAVLSRLFSTPGDLVIQPGRSGGTNALVVRHPEFRVDFHGTSYLDHREIADGLGLAVQVMDSFRLATDIDDVSDLVELFVHAEGHTRDWLDASSLSLTETDNGVTVERECANAVTEDAEPGDVNGLLSELRP